MTQTKTRSQPRRVSRAGTVAAWVAAVACLPYLIFKVLWTVDIPVGISDLSVLDSGGWVAGNALMACVQLAGLALVLILTRTWAARLPAWLILFPAWVGTGLLLQVVVAAVLGGAFSASSGSGLDTGSFEPWVFLVVYASFAAEGLALAVAFASYVQSRWGELLAPRTAEVVINRRGEAQSWPEAHFDELAEIVAVISFAVAAAFGYWAAGGSSGLSTVTAQPPWALQASRAVGAVIAAIGLLALAGRLGQAARLWLPAAFTWLGSGALTAFDGLTLTLNNLLPMVGAAPSGPGWTLIDTFLVFKALIGLLAAALGFMAFRVAVRHANRLQRPTGTADVAPA